jgi:hypothetical protein
MAETFQRAYRLLPLPDLEDMRRTVVQIEQRSLLSVAYDVVAGTKLSFNGIYSLT